MKFKYKLLGILCLMLLVFTTACGKKTAITSSDFKEKMESKGYTVEDATSQFSDYDYVKQVYIALNSDSEYQIEFYELSDNDNASSFFNNNRSTFEQSKSSSSSETSSSVGNTSKYTLTTNDKFKLLSRIDNTVIYLDVSEEYKSEVKDIIKELGY